MMGDMNDHNSRLSNVMYANNNQVLDCLTAIEIQLDAIQLKLDWLLFFAIRDKKGENFFFFFFFIAYSKGESIAKGGTQWVYRYKDNSKPHKIEDSNCF